MIFIREKKVFRAHINEKKPLMSVSLPLDPLDLRIKHKGSSYMYLMAEQNTYYM